MEDKSCLANASDQACRSSIAQPSAGGKERGFALVSLLALLPLLLALMFGLGTSLYIIKKKSLAQSLCLRSGIQLQAELKRKLERLFELNPKANRLEARRVRAEKAFRAAVASGIPHLIAAAKANKTAILIEQTQLKAKQLSLLEEAIATRVTHQQRLRLHLQKIKVNDLKSTSQSLGLAVYPVPPFALTPEYEPTDGFAIAQQQQYRFNVDLNPPFDLPFSFPISHQPIECSVSIEGDPNEWRVKILEASAPPKRCLSC